MTNLTLLTSGSRRRLPPVANDESVLYKRGIQFGVSFLLATLYTIPWIALIEQFGSDDRLLIQHLATRRILFLFTCVFLSALLFLEYNLYWKSALNKYPPFRGFTTCIVNGLLIMLVSYLSFIAAVSIFGREQPSFYFIRYLPRNFMLACVCLLVVYVFDLIRMLSHEKINIANLQNEKLQTELEVLRAQINPHFFFNSLNSLSFLIREDENKALEFISHLSHSFRYIFEHRHSTVVSVSAELSYLQSYIFMMHQRFGNNLRFEISIEKEVQLKLIPQFALQLVVENAIKHNVMSAARPLTVSILSAGSAIVVRNNVQLKPSGTPGFGIGLENLSRRYYLLNAGQVQVSDTGSVFEVILPIQ